MKIQGFWYMMPCRLVNSCQHIARFPASIMRADGKLYNCTALKVRAASYSSISERFASLQVIILNYYRAAVRSLISQMCTFSCHLRVFAGILCPVCKEIWRLQCLILCQKEMTTQRMRTRQRYISECTSLICNY
jgi:hypothetical protein